MPKVVVAISGKRKSGKDYCAKILKAELERRQFSVEVTGISNSLKMEYAKIHNLKYAELLTDGPYKEVYRKDMIKWGENVRRTDSSYFCRAAIPSQDTTDVVIISDCRRPTDYAYFVENYKTLTIRIETSLEQRAQRGFQFVEGVDDADSECALDDYNFDLILNNFNGENLEINYVLERILENF